MLPRQKARSHKAALAAQRPMHPQGWDATSWGGGDPILPSLLPSITPAAKGGHKDAGAGTGTSHRAEWCLGASSQGAGEHLPLLSASCSHPALLQCFRDPTEGSCLVSYPGSKGAMTPRCLLTQPWSLVLAEVKVPLMPEGLRWHKRGPVLRRSHVTHVLPTPGAVSIAHQQRFIQRASAPMETASGDAAEYGPLSSGDATVPKGTRASHVEPPGSPQPQPAPTAHPWCQWPKTPPSKRGHPGCWGSRALLRRADQHS